VRSITRINKEEFRKNLVSLSKGYTTQADMEFDEHGKIIRKEHPGNDLGLSDTIVVDRDDGESPPDTLFDLNDKPAGANGSRLGNRKARKAKATRKSRKKTRKR